jgi:hypothetical protein
LTVLAGVGEVIVFEKAILRKLSFLAFPPVTVQVVKRGTAVGASH